MNVQITDVGMAALNANAGVITLSLCKIGNGYNYVPSPTDTDIHGALVFSGVPSAPVAVNANVVKYGFYMDYSVGDFAYGEFGLFMSNGDLFALGCSSTLYEKLKLNSANVGNSVRLDIYLSVNNQNYEMWFDIGESNNQFRLAVLQSPDVLPQSKDATPNAYVVQGATPDQNAVLAFTDRNGLWTFDAYQFINQVSGTIVGADSQSVTIALSTYTTDMTPEYFGQVLFEFSSGVNYSICRYVSGTITGGGVVRLNFATPLLKVPAVGDTFVIFKRNPLSSSNVQIPVASATVLGGIKVGSDFNITNDGVLSLNPVAIGWVLSVNGMTGDVELTADDIPGLATVAKTGLYSDLIGAPGPYTLPVASQTTLGGIKTPSNGNLSVSSSGVLDLGFTPVKTVDGVQPDANGNVVPPPNIGLVNPQAIPSNSDLNTFTTTGLFYVNPQTGTIANAPTSMGGVLEVLPLTSSGVGSCVQRYDASDASFGSNIYMRLFSLGVWSSWTSIGGQPNVASNTVLGVVMIAPNAGLDISSAGILSSQFKSVNGKTFDPVSGVIQLTAADVNALSAANIGKPSGIPGYLTDDGVVANPDYLYQNARLPQMQLPLGTTFTAGTWNAATNALTATPANSTYDFTLVSLANNGAMVITLSDSNGQPYNATVNAEGRRFYVSTAGTTTIDGISSWSVGDVVESINGMWRRSGSIGVRSVLNTLPDATGNVPISQATLFNTLAGALAGRTTAGANSALSIYATGSNALYLNRDGGQTVYFGNGSGSTVAYVDSAGNGVFTNATALSDIREKENIESVTGALQKIMKLRYITYNLKGQPDRRLLSTVAQDLQKVQPETVLEREDGKLGVYTEGHVALLGAALQETYRHVEVLESVVRSLVEKVNQLNRGE